MAIKRIFAHPADVQIGAYTWATNSAYFTRGRVSGAFYMVSGDAIELQWDQGTEVTWFHFVMGKSTWSSTASDIVQLRDASGAIIATFYTGPNTGSARVGGTAAQTTPSVNLTDNTLYTVDMQVIVNSTVTVRLYVNGVFIGEHTQAIVRGLPTRATLRGVGLNSQNWFSEVIAADEDTRGMRLRELRPQSFGVFQEWDGTVVDVADGDMTTGIHTTLPDRRVSFGVTNIENISGGDIINRVVTQSYAQRGESAITKFKHFFRFRDTTLGDGPDHDLELTGKYFIDDFTVNPVTGVAWTPEDLRSVQTGVCSVA